MFFLLMLLLQHKNLLALITELFELNLRYEYCFVLYKYMETFSDSIDKLCVQNEHQLLIIGLS